MLPKSWFGQVYRLALAGWLVLVSTLGGGDNIAFAQVTDDPSLGTRVEPNGATFKIKGGTEVGGTNLFHSFSSFSVSSGQVADFLNASTIKNILARVTGGAVSHIEGQIRAQGSANLFLINPNGILFGRDARLNIGGSFIGTTANAVLFPGSREFSMTSQVDPHNSLLAVDPSALLFNQIAAKPITNQSTAIGLRVDYSRSLLLVGGNVNLDGGYLQAPNGRVELGGVGAGTVGLSFDDRNPRLSYLTGQLADVSLTNGARVTVSGRDSGDIKISGRRVTLTDGSAITNTYSGPELGGTLVVTASELVELTGGSLLSTQAAIGSGTAGALKIETGRLVVRDGAQASASSSGTAKGGELTVTAKTVQLIGTAADGNPSGLFATTTGNGTAGVLRIVTGRLIVQGGAQASASTTGSGQGGTLTVTAKNSVELTGTAAIGERESGLFVGTTATGVAGDLSIEAGQLIVKDGAVLSARTSNRGQGGNIMLQVRDLLLLRRNAQISTAAGTPDAGGDGGDINIKARFIVAVPTENSDIIANAFDGQGGNIDITTQGIYGLNYRSQLTDESDINASSQYGVNGTVQINTPDVDLSRGLTNLPIQVVDPTNQIAQNCAAGAVASEQSQFLITGRGGLPRTPSEGLETNAVWVDLVTLKGQHASPTPVASSRETRPRRWLLKSGNPPTRLAPEEAPAAALSKLNSKGENRSNPVSSINSTTPTSASLLEAQGWVINNKGQVVLTAQAPITPHSSWQKLTDCHTLKPS